MRSFIIATFVLLSTLSLAQSVLDTDPKLQEAISLRDKDVSLAALLADIQKQRGVAISAAPVIKDLKLNVFCENQPTSKVLDKVAELFFFEWQKTKDGYLLVYPRNVKLEQDNLVAAEAEYSLGRLKSEVANLVTLSQTPLAELEQQYEQAKADAARAQVAGDKQAASTLLRKSGNLGAVVRMRQSYYFGKLMANRGTDDPIWQGEPLVASARAGQGSVRLPGEALGNTKATPAPGNVENTVLLAFLNRADSSLSIAMEDVLSPPANPPRRSLVTFMGSRPDGADSELAGNPFHRRLDAWSTPTESSRDPVLDLKLELGKKIDSPYPQGIGAGEVFESLFGRSKTLIVTDSFRVVVVPSGSDVDGGTVRDWLSHLQAASREGLGAGPGFLRISDGTVMYRHRGFWRYQQQEPPTGSVVNLEQRLEAKKELRLEDLAAFASTVSDAQAAFFQIPDRVLTRFDPSAGLSIKALQFYGSLGRTQQTALASDGLDIATLSSTQSRLLWRAILETLGNTLAEGTPLDVLASGLSGEAVRAAGKITLRVQPGGAELKVTIPTYQVDATLSIRSRDLKGTGS